jgi:hypothetical protein
MCTQKIVIRATAIEIEKNVPAMACNPPANNPPDTAPVNASRAVLVVATIAADADTDADTDTDNDARAGSIIAVVDGVANNVVLVLLVVLLDR